MSDAPPITSRVVVRIAGALRAARVARALGPRRTWIVVRTLGVAKTRRLVRALGTLALLLAASMASTASTAATALAQDGGQQPGAPGGKARLAGGGMPGAGATPGGATGPAGVTALCAAPAIGEQLAVGGDQAGGVFFVRLEGEELVRDSIGKLPGPVAGVAWSRGEAVGRTCWAVDDAGGVWKLVAGEEPRRVAADPTRAGALALAASPDGALLAVAGVDGRVRLWSCGDGSARGELEGHAGPVSGLCWTASALWSVGWDATLRSWDVDPRQTKHKAKGRPLTFGARELASVVASPDGDTLIVLGHDGAVHVVDASKRKAVTLPGRPYQEYARSAAFTPDGAKVVVALPAEGAIAVLDPAHPERAAVSTDDARAPSCVAFGPDGRLIVGHFMGTFVRPQPPGLPPPVAGAGGGAGPGNAGGRGGANGAGRAPTTEERGR